MNSSGRIVRHRVLLLIMMLILILSTACGSSSKSESPRPASAPQPAAKTAAPAPANGNAKPLPELRKVIETAQVTLETKDLPTTESRVRERLSARKGILNSANVTLDGNGRRTGNFTLRIPAGQLQDFVNELASLPDVIVRQRSISSQDVTEEVVDITARLENMQRHEKRLREILATANTVEEVLKVEKELATVRTQIESTTGKLKALSGKIEMSTLQLRISEVAVITETNFFGKLKAILRDSWVAAGDVVLYLIATVIVLSPIGILAVGILWWWKRRQKAKMLSNQFPYVNNNPPPPAPK